MAVSDSPGCHNFRSTLSGLLSADNETRAKAEKVYGGIESPEKLFLLVAAIQAEGMPLEEAEMAAVLLRKLITGEFEKVFPKLPPETNNQIKSQILQVLGNNIDPSLRRKISDAAAELARNYVDEEGNNHWPEFLMYLFEAARSTEPRLKEAALLMFASVPGVFGNQQSKYIAVIHNMLIQSLTDHTSIDVRFAAVKATSSFILFNESEVDVQKHFSDCVHMFLRFLTELMQGSDPDPIDDLLRYLVDIVDKCPQTFRSQTDNLFQICLKCVSSPNASDSSRHLALEVIVTLAESASAMVRKLCAKHIPALLEVILKLMTDLEDCPESEWVLNDDVSDDESDSNNIVGEAALDRIACALGGKTILPVVLNSLTHLLNSPDWKNRYAGLMTISAVGEGCYKQMCNLLPQIVEGVLPFLMDSHSRVRYAACNALGQMASDFAPIFQKKFGDKVVNGLLQLLGESSSPRVQAHAGAALVNFFEDCPKNVLTLQMDNVADRLESVLNTKLNELVQKGTKLVLEQIVVTVASLADYLREQFVKYYDKFMPFLKFIIQNAHQPNLKLLRGKTIECISLIGLAVGKEKFLNDAGEVMDLLLKAHTDAPLSDDDPQLTYMIAAWARLCKILGKGFAPYLPFVMEPVLKAASLKPEVAVLDVEDMKVVDNDDDWEFVNFGEKHNFGIRTTGLEEKSTACQMLVCYAKELKEAFSPYVEEILKLMLPMLKFYFHDGVRSAAAEIMPHLLEASKGKGETYVQQMWNFILTPFLQTLESEPETEVLCDELGAFAQCIEVLNYHCFTHDELLALIDIIKNRLLDHFKKADDREELRKIEDYDELLEEKLEIEDDDDVYILSKISDVICTLFSIYKQGFLAYFDLILPQYALLLQPGRTWADRQWALCVFADVIEHGGPFLSKYQGYFLRPLVDSLTDVHPDLRQTAAYAIGCLGQHGGPQYAKLCADTIPILINMINHPDSRSEENIKATENAISAITKFIMCSNTFIHKDELIPLWISWLPIWEDLDEAKFVYNFLCFLLETNNPILLGNENCNIPRIVQIIAEAFHKEAIDPLSDVGKRVLALMRDIQSNQDIFAACFRTLALHQQEALHAALTKQ